ncbi:cellobiose dehydrogenase [Fusarium sporotrichioides]|uniref:Cellobiose dehydrogenase n=1 Tax=Fusarium sporotrichioides TaxID=5514 RepID=A0A395SQ39_FUSSP|nr:cellobiose dehydrogenase [Fusarium sporotrichioides]
MRFSTLFSSAALMFQAVSAASEEYKDADTGITFQQFVDKSSKFTFGIAMPETPSTDFIGQIIAPISEGYASVGMGSTMSKKLLVVAWPNDGKVLSSVRQASGYTSPDVLDDDTVKIKPIEKGVKVGTDSFTFTFLCEGCIKTDGTTFKASDANAVMAFAFSTTPLDDPTDASGALNYHGAGFGGFSVDAASSQSADYDTWAAMASDDSAAPGSGSGSDGSAPSTGNFTTVVSNMTYDYIVVGGGPAGIIVAERLLESQKSVLLLERGKASFYSTGGKAVMDWNETTTQYDVPAMAYHLTNSKVDTSEYCTDTASMAGCILGGGTAVNAMMFVRPQRADFDDKWPAGWKYDDVEAAASRLWERTPGTLSPTKDGKLVDQSAYTILSQFFSGNGFSEVDGIAQPDKKKAVFTHPPMMITDGQRAGPVRDYLPLAQANSNFKLMLESKVMRVVREGKEITGVEIQSGPATRQIIKVKTGGAVILAAGALSTPRLLVNSGIGPAKQIETVASGSQRLTMPPKNQWIDLPVGENLKDHPIFTVKVKTKTPMAALPDTAFTEPSQENVDLYAQGTGLLAQSGQRFIFWDSVKGSDGVERYVQGTCAPAGDDALKLKVYLTHGSTSSGALEVTSSGATKLIGEPYLNDAADKEAVKSFMQKLIDMTSKPNSTISIASNATAESLMAEYISGSHFVGSAIMGTENDGSSVVDTDTKVWGTDNLYVVDASVHPDLPTGNTQAIVMVVAEHAASKILNGGSGSSSPVVPPTIGGGNDNGSGSGSSPVETPTYGNGPSTPTGPVETPVNTPVVPPTYGGDNGSGNNSPSFPPASGTGSSTPSEPVQTPVKKPGSKCKRSLRQRQRRRMQRRS